MSSDEIIYRFLKVNHTLKVYEKSKLVIDLNSIIKEGNLFLLWHELKNAEYLNKLNKKNPKQKDKIV